MTHTQTKYAVRDANTFAICGPAWNGRSFALEKLADCRADDPSRTFELVSRNIIITDWVTEKEEG